MSFLYITEYAHTGEQGGDPVQCAFVPQNGPIAEQKIAIGGGSVSSAAFNTNTKLLRLHSDAICSILFGITPVATVASGRMAANQTEYFFVQPGNGMSVAVIANT
jgi:hypothetical protein